MGRVHPEDSKSHNNVGPVMIFLRGRWHCVKLPSFRARNRQFAHVYQVSWMAVYMNAELANMYLAYESADCSGPASQRL